MAIDSREKRASLVGIAIPMMIGVTPDATPDQAWRQAVGWGYYGILASGSVAPSIPATLEDLTTLWMQKFEPAVYAAQAVGAVRDLTTLADYDMQTNGLGYDGEEDLNTALAKYFDTEF